MKNVVALYDRDETVKAIVDGFEELLNESGLTYTEPAWYLQLASTRRAMARSTCAGVGMYERAKNCELPIDPALDKQGIIRE